MTTLSADAPPESQPVACPRIRVVYRDGSGAIHVDVPAGRIGAAVGDREGTVWVDIESSKAAANGEIEALLRDVFHFHALAIEDALKEVHVPRVDDWGDYLYLVFHTIDFESQAERLRLRELDIFLGPNYLVTHHIEPIPELDQLRKNIERDPANRLRHGAARLLYNVLDACVDAFLPAIEHLDEVIDTAQSEVFRNPTQRTLQSIFRVKRAALRLHRILGPEREVLNRLARDDYAAVPPDQRIYFRDVYDHVVRIHDIMESLRDLISGALDTYLSAISNRTNEIMKTLTLVTVMFLPMSFVSSFFGMNFFGNALAFEKLPPKTLLFALACLIMVAPSWGMYLWARRRKWF